MGDRWFFRGYLWGIQIQVLKGRMTVGHINKLQDGQVVIVASFTKFTDNVDFNWGYCFATNSFKSEIFTLDIDDFWMAKLQAIDEVIHRFSEPTVFFIRGVRFSMSVHDPVGWRRDPSQDQLCEQIGGRMTGT